MITVSLSHTTDISEASVSEVEPEGRLSPLIGLANTTEY